MNITKWIQIFKWILQGFVINFKLILQNLLNHKAILELEANGGGFPQKRIQVEF